MLLPPLLQVQSYSAVMLDRHDAKTYNQLLVHVCVIYTVQFALSFLLLESNCTTEGVPV